MAAYQGQILTELGAKDRLVSYYEVMEKPEHILREYIEIGYYAKPKKKTKKKRK